MDKKAVVKKGNTKKRKMLASLVLTLMITLGLGSTVLAATESGNATIIGRVKDNPSSLPSGVSEAPDGDITPYDASYLYFEVDGKVYVYKQSDEANIAASINSQTSASQVTDDIKGITTGLHMEPDINTATHTLSGFEGIINTGLGLIIVLVSTGMTVFTAFDICYISFPVFRGKCDDAKSNGNSMMTKTNKATGESKFRLITDEAVYAVQAADTTQSGRNPLSIYFGKRWLAIVLTAIVLFIFLTGNMTIFTTIALKLVSGILDIINVL